MRRGPLARILQRIQWFGATPPLPGITETAFSGVADCRHLGLSVDAVSAGLTFAKKDLSIEALAGLANRTGTVKLTRIGDAEGFSEPDEA